jgi:hypothetical protein
VPEWLSRRRVAIRSGQLKPPRLPLCDAAPDQSGSVRKNSAAKARDPLVQLTCQAIAHFPYARNDTAGHTHQ